MKKLLLFILPILLINIISVSAVDCGESDFNRDGKVNYQDIGPFSSCYGQQDVTNPFQAIWDEIANLKNQISQLFNITSALLSRVNILEFLSACPNDMVRIRNYCIDKTYNAQGTWLYHEELCGNESKRMCAHSELYYTCKNPPSGFTNIASEGEWTDMFVPSGGGILGYTIGWMGTCRLLWDNYDLPTQPHRARCCK